MLCGLGPWSAAWGLGPPPGRAAAEREQRGGRLHQVPTPRAAERAGGKPVVVARGEVERVVDRHLPKVGVGVSFGVGRGSRPVAERVMERVMEPEPSRPCDWINFLAAVQMYKLSTAVQVDILGGHAHGQTDRFLGTWQNNVLRGT